MTIVHVYDPLYWSIWFEGTPYNTTPKKAAVAKGWGSNADVVYNLALFNMSNYTTISYVKAQGCDVGYASKGDPTELLTVSPGNVCGGYALGISNNEVKIHGGGSSRTRSGIGVTKLGKVIIAQSTHKLTERIFCNEVLAQVSSYYKDRVKLFLMEDGGGSTQSWSQISKLGIAPEGGRKVPTATCVKRKAPQHFTRTLKIGCKGEDVRYLQLILGGLVCDGDFGNTTKRRLKDAQRALGITADGSCGPLTQEALGL